MPAFHKLQNRLRRGDENEPERALRRPHDELIYGGFSAAMARMRRGAKSVRKAAGRVRHSRKMH